MFYQNVNLVYAARSISLSSEMPDINYSSRLTWNVGNLRAHTNIVSIVDVYVADFQLHSHFIKPLSLSQATNICQEVVPWVILRIFNYNWSIIIIFSVRNCQSWNQFFNISKNLAPNNTLRFFKSQTTPSYSNP